MPFGLALQRLLRWPSDRNVSEGKEGKLTELASYWQFDKLHSALSLLDRDHHLNELDRLLRHGHNERRSVVMLVPAIEEDLFRLFPYRISKHFSSSSSKLRPLMLGCLEWNKNLELDDVLQQFHEKMQSAAANSKNSPKNNAPDQSRSPKQRFEETLSEHLEGVIVCKIVEFSRYKEALDLKQEKFFVENIKQWLKYFCEDCPGPRGGSLVVVLIIETGTRIYSEISETEISATQKCFLSLFKDFCR